MQDRKTGMLEKAFAQEVPVIIDVAVDYDENVKLSKRLKEWKESGAKADEIMSY